MVHRSKFTFAKKQDRRLWTGFRRVTSDRLVQTQY